MGDRCDVYIKFGGKISRAAADALVQVLIDECYICNATGEAPSIENIDEDFSCGEVDYANIDAIGAVCREHGIDYDMHHGQGGGYGAGCVRLMGGKHVETCGGDEGAMIPLAEILKTETLASGLGDLIAKARFMCGDFPNLEIVDTTMPEVST